MRTALMPSSTRCSGASVMCLSPGLSITSRRLLPAPTALPVPRVGRLSRAPPPGLRAVRQVVPGIDIGAQIDLPDVVPEIDAGGFVIIDDADFAPDHLREPDRGGVADSEVPRGPYQRRRVIGHAGEA